MSRFNSFNAFKKEERALKIIKEIVNKPLKEQAVFLNRFETNTDLLFFLKKEFIFLFSIEKKSIKYNPSPKLIFSIFYIMFCSQKLYKKNLINKYKFNIINNFFSQYVFLISSKENEYKFIKDFLQIYLLNFSKKECKETKKFTLFIFSKLRFYYLDFIEENLENYNFYIKSFNKNINLLNMENNDLNLFNVIGSINMLYDKIINLLCEDVAINYSSYFKQDDINYIKNKKKTIGNKVIRLSNMLKGLEKEYINNFNFRVNLRGDINIIISFIRSLEIFTLKENNFYIRNNIIHNKDDFFEVSIEEVFKYYPSLFYFYILSFIELANYLIEKKR